MRLPILAAALLLLGATPPPPLPPQLPGAASSEMARWRAAAARVTITRDDWGVAHIHGRSDADAVFGAIYAQAEDDFPRIEANYLTALGRTAEAEGEAAIWADLRQRLWIDPVRLQADYRASPAWLRALMDAWADGLNFYLVTHPQERPKVLTRFEPWMALSFTEGSIGGDIGRVDLSKLAEFYGQPASRLAALPDPLNEREPGGSNGIAIAPRLTRAGHALLLVNPHTSLHFRSELQMTSDAGLNAYGASTWGQFFLYQGWNERIGWMHTTSGADTIDEFAETVTRRGPDLITYRYGRENRPFRASSVTIRFRKPDGGLDARSFTVWRTHRGPITHRLGAKWITTALMDRPIAALEQSWLRTRARSYAAFLDVARRQANSSNNTVYADADGRVALLLPQFVPVRDNRFDYRKPVDGADPATDWRGLTPLAQLPQVVDPRSGWLYNSNDAPWWAAGAEPPHAPLPYLNPARRRPPGMTLIPALYPRYMDQNGRNPRGDAAIALLEEVSGATPDSLRAIAYHPGLPLFDTIVPIALRAYDAAPARYAGGADSVATLRGWNRHWDPDSAATTLANFWGERLWRRAAPLADPPARSTTDIIQQMDGETLLSELTAARGDLIAAWGRPDVPWGEVNRFQRPIPGAPFDDAGASTPVPFASARWGSLASFGAGPKPGTKRWYGTSGNSFVAVVQFGPRVRAWAVMAGGASGRPGSPHFADQAARYAAGELRPVYFWPDELAGHVKRRYRPGQ